MHKNTIYEEITLLITENALSSDNGHKRFLSASRDAQRPLMEGMFFSFFLYCSCIFILVFFLLVRWLLVVLFVICYFFKTLCRDLQGVLNSRRGFLPPIMVLNKLVSSKKYLWFIPKMNFKDQLNCNKSSRPLF